MINNKNNVRVRKVGGYDSESEGILIVNNFFCYLSLYISYILFGMATIIFFNSCFNLNKTSIDNNTGLLINQPIFEYLKEDNFMYIDEYLLNIKSPICITLISIFSISLFAIFCIWLWLWMKYDKVSLTIPDEIDNKTFYIAILPYLFMFITIITYNEFRSVYINDIFTNFDKDYNKYITKDIMVEDPSYLKELNKIIIFMIENDKVYISDEDIRSKIVSGKNIDSEVVSIANKIKFNTGDNKISILKLILDIYEKDYKSDKNDKIKYIKYINYYFDLLINKRKDNYARYYILGLAKNAHKNSNDPNDLNDLNNTFRDILFDIKNKIYVYFLLVIIFYCVFVIISLTIYWYYEKNRINKFIIDTSYNIYSITIIFSLFFAFIIYFVLFYTKKI